MALKKVETPRGSFIGWGARPGQCVTGTLADYDPTGATIYKSDERIPLLEIELTEPASSFNKSGAETKYEPGEHVFISCSQVNLRRQVKYAVKSAGLKPGVAAMDRERLQKLCRQNPSRRPGLSDLCGRNQL
jgi:hypothetical protein